jgi:transposase
MIDRQTVFEILRLDHEGLSIRKISDALCLSRKTVAKYIDNPNPQRKYQKRASKLDPFKEEISRLLQTDPKASAVVIKQRLDPLGFTGGITILKDYLSTVRPAPTNPTPYIRFESAPGEQMQIDWGHFGSLSYGATPRKLYALAVIECYSRMLYVEFTHSQKQESLHQCLLNAFSFFGGSPKELVFDNMPTAVIERQGRLIRFNDAFLQFLTTFKIFPKACNVRAAHEKGKVERIIGYIRKNFWPLRILTTLADVQSQLRHWLITVANVRVQQTTGERPSQRFAKVTLRPLPQLLPDCRETKQLLVHKDFAVRFDGNCYTAPPWAIGKHITLKASQNTISLYDRQKIMAIHNRCWQKNKRIELPGHKELVKKIQKKLWQDRQIALFASLAPQARAYLNALADANQPIKKNVLRLLALKDDYGSPALIYAIEKALSHRAYGADYIENILYQEMTPQRSHPPVKLKDDSLNQIRLNEPCLADYDSLILKRRKDDD